MLIINCTPEELHVATLGSEKESQYFCIINSIFNKIDLMKLCGVTYPVCRGQQG
jgi:hypothetical protein